MKTALRIDDVGACSKKYEVYSKRVGGNFLFLKYLPFFKAWGVYRELNAKDWELMYKVLRAQNARMTVGITAAWVESDNALIPFPEKFAAEAGKIKEGIEEGLIEIANHGLTHCVVGMHRPRYFSSNRKYHREFLDWLPANIHYEHIRRSQDILQEYFKTEVITLIPPGNSFTQATIDAAEKCAIKIINCQKPPDQSKSNIRILGNENIVAFHDRDILFNGMKWFEKKVADIPGNYENCFVKELV